MIFGFTPFELFLLFLLSIIVFVTVKIYLYKKAFNRWVKLKDTGNALTLVSEDLNQKDTSPEALRRALILVFKLASGVAPLIKSRSPDSWGDMVQSTNELIYNWYLTYPEYKDSDSAHISAVIALNHIPSIEITESLLLQDHRQTEHLISSVPDESHRIILTELLIALT